MITWKYRNSTVYWRVEFRIPPNNYKTKFTNVIKLLYSLFLYFKRFSCILDAVPPQYYARHMLLGHFQSVTPRGAYFVNFSTNDSFYVNHFERLINYSDWPFVIASKVGISMKFGTAFKIKCWLLIREPHVKNHLIH